MKYKLLLTLISVALFSQSVLAAKGGNKPDPQQNIPEPGQAVFVDAIGTMLGDVQTNVGLNIDNTVIYFNVNEKFYGTFLNDVWDGASTSFVFGDGELYYDQPGCTGNSYSSYRDENFGDIIIPRGGREGVIYIQDGGTSQTFDAISSVWRDDGDFWECVFNSVPTQCIDIADIPTELRARCLNYVSEFLPAVPLIDTNIYAEPFRLKLTPPN